MAVDLCIKTLERIRTDVKFKAFYDSVVMKASQLFCDPPVLPRQRQIPRRLDDGTAQHSFSSVEKYYSTLMPLTMNYLLHLHSIRTG